ncbi:hypothetical protein C1645_738758 [Glomus cerebriforme]|uniref:HMG box domain-containing protein n=1 Tax=Glomus cerebriforme TaxID=658196 RepID=A0A397SSX0_9GLOM|nr:hypothetical protein C1645_738758 [Glomus cerebriforme]
MTDTMSQQKEFVFISVDGKQTKNIAITPPENLKVEFPPKFTDSELGRTHDKKGSGKNKKPPNAFILFRKKYVESLHRLGHHDAMKKVSGWARDAWNKLSQNEKDQYEFYANRAASLYQEWEIRNPQPTIRQPTTRRKKNTNVRGPSSNRPAPIQTIQLPKTHSTHLLSPKSSPESLIDIFPEYDRNCNQILSDISTDPFPGFQNILYYPTNIMYESSIMPDCFFNVEDNYSVPPLTEIQPTNNQFYEFDYFSNPKLNYL